MAQLSEAMVASRARNDLDSYRQFSLALTPLLEIAGEAANRIPKDGQSRHPEIAWPDIITLRNRPIHGYDSVTSISFGKLSRKTRRRRSKPSREQ